MAREVHLKDLREVFSARLLEGMLLSAACFTRGWRLAMAAATCSPLAHRKAAPANTSSM